MIGGVYITRQCNIWVSVNPYHSHVILILLGKVCERHDTYGTFAAKCYDFIRILYLQYIQSRLCLAHKYIPVKHAIRNLSLCKSRCNGDCDGFLPVVGSEKIQ